MKNDPAAGGVAVYASNFAPTYFANFEYRISDEVEIIGSPFEVSNLSLTESSIWHR